MINPLFYSTFYGGVLKIFFFIKLDIPTFNSSEYIYI